MWFQPFWRLWNASGSDGRGVIGTMFALKSQVPLNNLT